MTTLVVHEVGRQHTVFNDATHVYVHAGRAALMWGSIASVLVLSLVLAVQGTCVGAGEAASLAHLCVWRSCTKHK